ncbi:MAG TPA: hypothetical protein VIY51_03970, partial [Xanthobacteraceae bacterium]
MDGRGRIAQPLTWIALLTSFWRARRRARPASHAYASGFARPAARSALRRWLRRSSIWLFNLRVPTGAGLVASGAFLLAT